jgi:hypothetical protein
VTPPAGACGSTPAAAPEELRRSLFEETWRQFILAAD